MIIGLTGGIGCGKSVTLNIFCQSGCLTTSADEINGRLLEQAETLDFIKKQFGNEYVKNKKIDKSRLAELIFSVPEKRNVLENFLHPQIFAEQEKTIRQAREENRICICEIPLLFEKNLEKNFDKTICIVCSGETQSERLEKRGLPRERARERIAAQMPSDEKIKRADFVIFNDGNIDFLKRQTKSVLEKLI